MSGDGLKGGGPSANANANAAIRVEMWRWGEHRCSALHENHMHEIALFIKTVVFEGYVLHTPSEEGGGKEQDAI